MKYCIVEADKLIKPLYKSNFPIYQKNRGGSEISAKLVKQFAFRKSISVYVDDIKTYLALGGREGSIQVERFYVSNYPTWRSLTGISTYDLPRFFVKEAVLRGVFPECQIIKEIKEDKDIIKISSESLIRVDSIDSLSFVCSVYFDYIKSWKQSISSESAETQEKKAEKWFSTKFKTLSLHTYKDAESWIQNLLNIRDYDSGIVRKAKCYDFCRLATYVGSHFGSSSLILLSGVNHIYDKYDIFRAAELLYGYDDDYPFYGAFDEKAVQGVVSSLSNLADQAKYLSNGISNNTISIDWAYAKLKELQTEWNESGFPINERGDTSHAWEEFNRALTFIKSRVK